MERPLQRDGVDTSLFYFVNNLIIGPNGKIIVEKLKFYGPNRDLNGNHHKISGDSTHVTGNAMNNRGDCSNIHGVLELECIGDLTGLIGCITGVKGNLDEISAEDRKEHPDIRYWVKGEGHLISKGAEKDNTLKLILIKGGGIFRYFLSNRR